jgi:hypothetical protein
LVFVLLSCLLSVNRPNPVAATAAGSCENAQDENATQADILLQLNPYSIDAKTDTMYSSYFFFRVTTYTNRTHLGGMILKRDSRGSYGFIGTAIALKDKNNKTYLVTQNFYEEHPTDPAKVLVPWSWQLVPRLFLGAPLASPWDYYQLDILLGFNQTLHVQLDLNSWITLPPWLMGDWELSQSCIHQSSAPTDSQLGEYQFGLLDSQVSMLGSLTDFYLFSATIRPHGIQSFRFGIGYLLASTGVLIVLVYSMKRVKKVSISDSLTVFLGSAFFTLSFLVSFYQYAPPNRITIQEVIFWADFGMATVLGILALKFNVHPSNSK